VHDILFITPGPVEQWASSRLRCTWVAKYIENSYVIDGTQIHNTGIPKSKVYVWEKIGNPETMRLQREAGALVFWDLCDPVWWFSTNDCREIVNNVSGVVLSNHDLRADFDQWILDNNISVMTECIPDRLLLQHYNKQKIHTLQHTTPVRFIWYGSAQNRVALFGAVAPLERLVADGFDIQLTIMDDRPDVRWDFTDKLPVYYTGWSLQHEVDIISSHDIALLPSYPGPWGAVKSNNKRLTAWACGLPATDGADYKYMFRLVDDPKERMLEARHGLTILQNEFDVKKSAIEWSEFIDACRNNS